MDFKQIKAREKANKERWLKVNSALPDSSGIYILIRAENDIKYAYVGQARHILTRLAQHLSGYQHIDLSLKKHGLRSQDNPTGWDVKFLRCELKDLDKLEQEFVVRYANAGYQLRNKTGGGQGEGKFGIADNKPSKGYRDGVAQGYRNAQKEISKLFESNLTYSINGKSNKLKERALAKFEAFLRGE